MTMNATVGWPRKRPRGQALVTVAVTMVALLGFVGLAIDVGWMMVARNELQNGADAAALAGAGALYKENSGTIEATPNWTRASDSTTNAIPFNKVNATALATGTVATGYWNLTGTPAGMQSKTKSPLVTGDAAAVSVVLRKATGQNGGPVALFLAPLLGVSAEGIKATAVAVVLVPQQHRAAARASRRPSTTACIRCSGTLPPTSPRSTPPPASPTSSGSARATITPSCDSGQWTSMFTDANDVPTVRDLIENGNPTAVSIGDSDLDRAGDQDLALQRRHRPLCGAPSGGPGREQQHPRQGRGPGVRAFHDHRLGGRQRQVHRGTFRSRLSDPGRNRRWTGVRRLCPADAGSVAPLRRSSP